MFSRLISSLGLFAVSFAAQAQSADSTTYTSGDLGVQTVFPVNLNSGSQCADTLGISIPSGHWITAVDVYYDLEGVNPPGPGGTSPSDVGVYLELQSEGLKESNLSYGTNNTNGGIESIARTGVLDFNGPVQDTLLVFKLHAFLPGFQTNCGTTEAFIPDSSWSVVVHHMPAPTCFQPTDLTVNWTMSNKAQLEWTTGGATAWEIEYGPVGFSPGSGTRTAALSNPFVVTGLSASTAYDFYVRDSCGTGDVSQWSFAVTDSTLCAPITFSTSYLEDFDGTAWSEGTGVTNAGSTIDACWNRNPTGPTGGQGYAFGTGTGTTGTTGTGPNNDRTGTGNYVYAEASGAQNQSVATLTSPLIDLSSLTVPQLSFWYHMAVLKSTNSKPRFGRRPPAGCKSMP